MATPAAVVVLKNCLRVCGDFIKILSQSHTLAGLIQADQISEGFEMVILYLKAPRWIKYATNIRRVPSFWEPVEALDC